MNVERLVAQRMARSNRELNSRPVVRIATSGVALGVALMILASAVVQGFQHEVKSLVVGFDSHVQIAASDPGARGVVASAGLLDTLRNVEGVAHVAMRHERAGIVETSEALQGVVIRGIDSTSMLSRIEGGLLRGQLPDFGSGAGIAVGAPLAAKLSLDTSSRLTLYVVVGPDDIRPRPLRVSGVYETGLLEFDTRHVWVPASLLQDAAARGAEGQVVLEAAGTDGLRAVGQAFGRDERGALWTGRWEGLPADRASRGRRTIALQDLSTDVTPLWIVGQGALADTVHVSWDAVEGWQADVSQGSHRKVIDGYDVWAESLDGMAELQERIFPHIPYDWQATRVDQQHPEMFSWLGMLDLNVDVIVGLMVLISIINMTSALLIIILERRSQIGLLKALGMNDGVVIRAFLWHAARILGTGFVWGNVAGLALVWIQATWHVVPLNPEAYYVDAVPILVDAPKLVGLEIVAFGLCVVAMVLPALWSTRIRPALTMRMT
jgi:lipoprotein-releasing system permease protein